MIDSINKKYFMIAVSSAKIGKITDNDISVRCPVCGDSQHKKNSTRLHLYNSNGKDFVHCFNGDCSLNSTKNMYSFLKDFFPALLDGYKRENFVNNIENLSNEGDVFSSLKEEPKVNVQTYDLSQYFKPILEVPECIQYVESRGIEYNHIKFGKWYYGHIDLTIDDTLYKTKDSVIIPLYYNDEMYGFYSRNIHKKDFATYMADCNVGYKVWNWFNIDKTKKVYIFEAIFDAIASGLPNVIALMGSKIPQERLKELDHPIFVLDNDKTGHINSIEYAKQGYEVFIQPNDVLNKDMNDILINTDIDIIKMVTENIYSGIAAQVRLKMKL